jgi:hypothetical protein
MALNSACKTCGTRLGPEDNDGPITQPEHCARCRASAKSNGFAAAGRMRKAIAMVGFIDRKAIDKGLSPYDQAGRILLVTREWDDATWETIGVGAGFKAKAISQATREMVRDVYRSRAKAPLQQVAS